MEADLRALLIGSAPLTALVPAARIVWNHLPQATTRPAIVLFRIAGAPGITMQGSDGLLGAVVQIDVQTTASASVTNPVSQMWAIRDALISLLHGHEDANFQLIALQDERQDSEQLTGGGLVHRSSLDFSVWHLPA